MNKTLAKTKQTATAPVRLAKRIKNHPDVQYYVAAGVIASGVVIPVVMAVRDINESRSKKTK